MPRTLRPEVALARKLRREMTLPEVLLWQQLRRKAMGLKFRKQHPIGPYTADFCCAETRLVVEVDGDAHNRADQPKRDATRNAFMTENGYSVLRIAATDVLRDMEAVTTAIRVHAARPLHHPSDDCWVDRAPGTISNCWGQFAPTIPPRAGEE